MRTRMILLVSIAACILLAGILLNTIQPAIAQAGIQDNQISFTGRRGVAYNADWNTAAYTLTFTTPDSTFPWDWIGFTGQHGSVALSGYPDLEDTLDRSDPNALTGTMPGDLWRIKGSGILSLAHLTKIGLVIGSGTGAQRAWFSEGTITEYYMAPHYVGYRVEVLGREATVRLSSLNPQDFHAVILIEVTLDDPSNARLIFASDLEPAMDYATAVEPHNRPTSAVAYDAVNEIVSGTGSGYTAYVYSDQPLHSWSANDLPHADYLAADSLDGLLVSGSSDARVALSIVAQEQQFFYLGSMVLDSATRGDPTSAWYALRDERLAALNAMPQIESLTLPEFEFTNFLSNLILSYLVNPNGGLFYTDKAFLYTTDAVIPMLVSPHLLPPRMSTAYEDGLTLLAAQQYAGTITEQYSFKFDTHGWQALPSWYGGNLPDIVHFNPNGVRVSRENYSDAYPTAEFINALYQYYLLTGDLAFIQSLESQLDAAVSGLLAFDNAYDAQYGEDGNRYPNIISPMADLGMIAGEYPAEASQTIYAYEDAAALWRLLGRNTDADNLIANYVTPMRAGYDAHFWDAGRNFYVGIADQNSQTHASGTTYNDWWGHVLFIPLRGDIGRNHQADLLSVITGSTFYEPTHDVHWISTTSDSFANQTNLQNWWLSTGYTNGWSMEGGYLVLMNAIIPISYYQMDQVAQAETYAEYFLDKWVAYGPHEAIMEYNHQTPGSIAEASLYIESAIANTWLLEAAMNLEINASQEITITPRLSGQFTLDHLNLTVLGDTAIINYERDDLDDEYITVIHNEGLTISAPNAQERYAIRWGSYDAAGQTTFGFYDQDDATPLETGDLAQLIWAGPDGIIDLPDCEGHPGGDDLLLDENTINNGDPLPLAAQNRGYLPWQVYVFDPTDPQNGGAIYIRAWNAASSAAATAYADTSTTALATASIFNAPRQRTGQRQNTWIGAPGGDWHAPANWNTVVIPDNTTRVLLHNGASAQLSAGAAARQICIDEDASLDLGTFDLTVENQLINAGELHQTRTIDATCTIGSPCSFLQIINGAGTQSHYYGAEIAQTSTTDLGNTTVTVSGGQACGNSGSFPSSVQRCFEITPTTPAEATITFYYRETEANGSTDPEVWHYNPNTQIWDPQTFVARGGSGEALFVRASGIEAYSPFALATNAPTAISMTNFQADSAANPIWLLLISIISGIAVVLIIWQAGKKDKHEK